MNNPNPQNPSDYAIIIAIDWADQKHDFRIRRGDNEVTKIMSNDIKELKSFFLELADESKERRVAVVIENTRSALMYLLQSIKQFDIYAVHPSMASKYSKTFHLSGAKSDAADTASLLDLFLKHSEKLSIFKTDLTQVALDGYNEKRRRLVDQRSGLGNQMKALLKMYFPKAIDVIGAHIHAPIFLDFIKQFPSPKTVLDCSQTKLTNFFNKRTSKKENTPKRVAALKKSVVLIDDTELLEMYELELMDYHRRILALNESIDLYDAKIKKCYMKNQDYEIFSSFPGAGPSIGPRIMAFFGNDRSRFQNVEDALTASEIAPVKLESGKMCIIRRRFLCDKFTQLTFVEFANNARLKSIWAQEFYRQKKAKGMNHFSILRALAFKWIRIIFRCWKGRVPYGELQYINALKKRNSTLVGAHITFN